MINKNKIIDLINKDDKILFSKIIDQYNYCFKNFEPTFSDFIPISKFMQFLQILNSKNEYFSLEYIIYGGFDDAERIIIGFFPEYMTDLSIQKFPITILEIKYNQKYSRILTHRDFLGSIIGLGIDRTKIGDIIIKENITLCFLHTDIIDYILFNLQKVGSTKVQVLQNTSYNQDEDIISNDLEKTSIITSSLRLDATLSASFNLSRSKISNYIKSNKVFLNFVECNSRSKIIKSGDIITIRGIGRIKIGEILGNTKKERIILQVYKYK